LNLNYGSLLSTFTFKFYLRRYRTEELRESFKFTKYIMLTRVFHDEVERCMLNSNEARLESACFQALKLNSVISLSSFALTFNLRCYNEDQPAEGGNKRKRGEPVVVYPRRGGGLPGIARHVIQYTLNPRVVEWHPV
jgi:hypothetical protein